MFSDRRPSETSVPSQQSLLREKQPGKSQEEAEGLNRPDLCPSANFHLPTLIHQFALQLNPQHTDWSYTFSRISLSDADSQTERLSGQFPGWLQLYRWRPRPSLRLETCATPGLPLQRGRRCVQLSPVTRTLSGMPSGRSTWTSALLSWAWSVVWRRQPTWAGLLDGPWPSSSRRTGSSGVSWRRSPDRWSSWVGWRVTGAPCLTTATITVRITRITLVTFRRTIRRWKRWSTGRERLTLRVRLSSTSSPAAWGVKPRPTAPLAASPVLRPHLPPSYPPPAPAVLLWAPEFPPWWRAQCQAAAPPPPASPAELHSLCPARLMWVLHVCREESRAACQLLQSVFQNIELSIWYLTPSHYYMSTISFPALSMATHNQV